MTLTLSVVVPTWNNPELLRTCLHAIRASTCAPSEVVVVDDCSERRADDVCAEYGASLIRLSTRSGSAVARNVGAERARGDIVMFVDGDVAIDADAIERVRANFADDPELDAVFGSYEARAGADNFVSQYKNFQHHFVHQHSRPEAWTFWSGCGAVRREVFVVIGGFRVRYPRPDIEDIEFGMRLSRAGGKLRLDRTVLASHLKRWHIRTLVASDVLGRAAPWTELLLQHRCLPDDLNLRWGQRLSVLSTALAVVAALAGCAALGVSFALPVAAMLLVSLAAWAVDAMRNGPTAATAVGATGAACLFMLAALYSGDLLLIPLVAVVYGLVLAGGQGRMADVYAMAALVVTFWQLPRHWLSFVLIASVVAIVWLNRHFYAFLGGRWRLPNTLSAIALHLLYYLSSATGAAIGVARHVIATRAVDVPRLQLRRRSERPLAR